MSQLPNTRRGALNNPLANLKKSAAAASVPSLSVTTLPPPAITPIRQPPERPDAEDVADKPQDQPRTVETSPQSAHPASRVKMTVRVLPDVAERLQAALEALGAPPYRMRHRDFFDEAVEHYLTRLEKEHNGGKPFRDQ